MKFKHLMLISGLTMAFALQSCIKEKDLYQEPPVTYSELNLKLDGDYLMTESPLSRSTTRSVIDESKTIVGIAISMTSLDTKNPVTKPYAYGIFDLDKAKDPNNLQIRVLDGYTYRISCTMIANTKDTIKNVNGEYGAPYCLDSKGLIKGKCLNKFLTAEQADGIRFLYNIDNTKVNTIYATQDTCGRPFIERYHGLLEKVEVKDGMENTIKLYRRFFGVKFKQTGLESGRLRIQIAEAPPIYLNASDDVHETMESELRMVCMKNITSKVPVEPNLYLTDNAKVEVFWEKTAGEKPGERIVNSTINFKRNYKHTIVLTNIDHIGTPGNIGIEIDNEEMGENPQIDIPWQGDNFNK